MNKFKWLAIIVSFFVILLGSSHLIYYSLFPRENLIFLKRNAINSQDLYTYLSFIEQAKQGRTLFENLYTSESQKPLLLRPSYLVIGKFAKLLNLSSINAYHLSRIFMAALFFFVLWKFLDHFFKEEKSKFIAYLLTLTSSGIGFLIFDLLPSSIDLWVPEANTFLILSEAPHFILSLTLMLLGFSSFLEFLKHRKNSDIVLSSLFFLLLSFEHPFNLLIVIPTLFITAIWSGISWKISSLIALGSTPGLLYQFYSSKINPILSAWQTQNILISPSLVNYLTGFGFLIILAFISIEKALNDKLTSFYKLLLVWVVVTGIFLYAPVDFQRRLIEGVHIPIAILASYGLILAFQRYKEDTKKVLTTLAIIVILSGNSIFSIYNNFAVIAQDKSDNYYYHIDPAEIKAIKWLGENSTFKDTILSNWYIGNLIPGIIGRKVYLGHSIQTINWEEKNKILGDFIRIPNVELSAKFLEENKITFVFVAKNDILIKNGFMPENFPHLNRVYDEAGVQIYKVE